MTQLVELIQYYGLAFVFINVLALRCVDCGWASGRACVMHARG